MKTRKIILILLPIGVVIASGACRRQSQSVPQSTNSNLAVPQEKDDSGKETGIFKGKWKTAVEPYELGMANIAGKWSRPDGTKETTFELTQQPIDFSAAAARFVPKVIKEANKQSRFRIDVVYPQIEGDARFDKFNKEARAMVTKNVAAFKTS